MKYKEIYNQIYSNIQLEDFVIYGESINNGSFIGGLASSLQGNKNTLINVCNSEYTHIGIGYGIALIGKKALYICKQLDFLLFGIDHFTSTNEIFKMSGSSGTFVMVTAAQDQGYQGPQSSFNRITSLSNLLEFTTFILNSENAFKAFALSMEDSGIKLGILSQKIYNENLTTISSELINFDGYEIYGNTKISNKHRIYASGFSIEYLKRYLVENRIDLSSLLIVNKYSNSISFLDLHSIFEFNLILDDDNSRHIEYPNYVAIALSKIHENESVRANDYENQLKLVLDKLLWRV